MKRANLMMGRAIDDGSPAAEQIFAPTPLMPAHDLLPSTLTRRSQERRGRRSHTTDGGRDGHVVRVTVPHGRPRDIALAATLRAAALRSADRTQGEKRPNILAPGWLKVRDLRIKVRRARSGNLILFVVDASGSMAARKRMATAKGALLSLLLDAYQQRDRVGLIAFRGVDAQLLVPPTNSVDLAEQQLRQLPTGGRTPLSTALTLTGQVLTRYGQRDGALEPLLVLVTDGRANSGPPLQPAVMALAQRAVDALVLDSEEGYVRLGAARSLATDLNAQYILLDQLDGPDLQRIIGATLLSRGRR